MPLISIITDRKHGRNTCLFYLPSNRTVDCVGSKTVAVRTTGHEKKTHFTTVLGCMADGTKLPPMVIFKRKTMPKEKFPIGVIVHVHQKGWMDTGGMLIWLQKSWGRRPSGGKSKEPACLGPISCTSRRQAEATYKQRPQHQHCCHPGGPDFNFSTA